MAFNDLASRVGVAAAHRRAGEYCGSLKGLQLDRFAGHSVGKTEDASRRAGPGRNRDLELTYLTFPVVMADGRFHDNAVLKEFRTVVLRTGQQWDQVQARTDMQKQERRRDAFRLRFGELLAGDTYQHLDKVTKDQLLDEVPELAFPPRGHELLRSAAACAMWGNEISSTKRPRPIRNRGSSFRSMRVPMTLSR